jgi:7-cyano-7-deazaguanine synthase
VEEGAVVLLSGGIDSAAALYWARREGYALYSLTIDYAQGSKTELGCAERLAKRVEVKEHFCFDLPFYRLIQERWPKPAVDQTGISTAYVPLRNVIFYGIGGALAETLHARWIVFGSNQDDAAVLPDATQEFVARMNQVLSLGSKSGNRGIAPEIINPFQKMSKVQVLKSAIELNVPLAETWSCYEDVPQPCGKCWGCLNRAETFRKAGIPDPSLTNA